jgi:hypothetical protein
MDEVALEAVETAFVTAVGEIAGVAGAYDHLPEKLDRRPAVTLLCTRFAPENVETGPQEDVTYEWRVDVHVDLGAGVDYRTAQLELRRLCSAVLTVTRRDSTLGHTCVRARMSDDGAEPEFDSDVGLLTKALRLSALLEET